MRDSNNRIVQLTEFWYVETKTGYDGPFDSHNEAGKYLQTILDKENRQRKFAGLGFHRPKFSQ